MGTRAAIVKDVAAGADLTDIKTAISNNSGTFRETQNLDVICDFPTDTDGAAFAVDAGVLGYNEIVWDLFALLRVWGWM